MMQHDAATCCDLHDATPCVADRLSADSPCATQRLAHSPGATQYRIHIELRTDIQTQGERAGAPTSQTQ